MKTPILGHSYVARSVNAADNRMINLYPETVPEGGKENAFLTRTPGMQYVFATAANTPVRGMWVMGSFLYVVAGLVLYKVDADWNVTSIGAVSGDGPVSMSDNGSQLWIACNPRAYVYTVSSNTLAEVTDPDFPGALMVTYLNGYFIFNQPNTQTFWITSFLDGTSIDPLNFDSATASPDTLVGLIADHGELWLFGAQTIEVWYYTGDVNFPFSRIQGAFNEIGCAAPFSIAKLDNTLFWLGNDARGNGIVYRANGYNGQRVSTHAIEWAIQQYEYIGDAIAYTYQQEGHPFYVLTFPTANATWVYDVATDGWHERAAFDNGVFYRHRSNCQANFNGKILVGDYIDGNVYEFNTSYYADGDQPLKWLRSWRALPTGQNNLKRTVQHSLQLDCESGPYCSPVEYFLPPVTTPIALDPVYTSTDLTIGLSGLTLNALGLSHYSWPTSLADVPRSSGKWYFEAVIDTFLWPLSYAVLGVAKRGRNLNASITTGDTIALYQSNVYSQGSIQATTDLATYPEKYAFAIDFDAGHIWMWADTKWANSGDPATGVNPTFTFTPNDEWYPAISAFDDGTPYSNIVTFNFGASPFENDPPAGFSPWQGGVIPVQVVDVLPDPQVLLRWSDDGGHTWSNQHSRTMGKYGSWDKRVIWRRLGATQKLRDRVYEITGSDPVKITIMGAELDVSGTNS